VDGWQKQGCSGVYSIRQYGQNISVPQQSRYEKLLLPLSVEGKFIILIAAIRETDPQCGDSVAAWDLWQVALLVEEGAASGCCL
jgi:hypothetical protein